MQQQLRQQKKQLISVTLTSIKLQYRKANVHNVLFSLERAPAFFLIIGPVQPDKLVRTNSGQKHGNDTLTAIPSTAATDWGKKHNWQVLLTGICRQLEKENLLETHCQEEKIIFCSKPSTTWQHLLNPIKSKEHSVKLILPEAHPCWLQPCWEEAAWTSASGRGP